MRNIITKSHLDFKLLFCVLYIFLKLIRMYQVLNKLNDQ